MKKVLSMVLVTLLLVAILPVGTLAASQPGSGSSALEVTQQDFANLERYLGSTHFAFRGPYNCAENDLATIMDRIWMADYQIYFPTAQMNDPWKNKSKDPQKRFSDTFYYKLDADKCDWIIKNIYNAAPDHGYSDRFTYYDGGYYYINVAGVGDAGYTAKIASKEPLADGKYYISYKVYMMFDNSLVGNRYVVADLKEIDGGRYWTFYEMSTSSINTTRYKTSAGPTAYASTQTVRIDGTPVAFEMYALKDANGNPTNYIKVRDLAYMLNGTAAQFEVGWYNGTVSLESGRSYTANGSEMSTPFSGDRPYSVPTGKTLVNGSQTDLQAIYLTDDNGGGYTYYKLRDLGQALGFDVDWSAEVGIFIRTGSQSAVKEEPAPEASVSDTVVIAGETVSIYETSLSFPKKGISDLTPFSRLKNLKSLALGMNAITDISPLCGLSSLTDLGLGGNNISDLSPLTAMTGLKKLTINYNRISSIESLSGLKNLTKLNIADNTITDISPLRGLTGLTDLDIHSNQISDISALSGLTELTRLVLVNNNISDISCLGNLSKLTYLEVTKNPIPKSQIQALREKLPNCTIYS